MKLINELNNNLPKCGLTTKNFSKFQSMGYRLWRRYIRNKRSYFQEQNKGYGQAKTHILQNPKNMDENSRVILTKHLKNFPFLKPFRNTIKRFHKQFDENNLNKPSLAFLRETIDKNTHNKLKSAVDTLIRRELNIFAYKDILAQHPQLKKGKSIRSNHEEINKNANLVARNQYGLRSTSGARLRLQSILECPIIVSEALLKWEKKDL